MQYLTIRRRHPFILQSHNVSHILQQQGWNLQIRIASLSFSSLCVSWRLCPSSIRSSTYSTSTSTAFLPLRSRFLLAWVTADHPSVLSDLSFRPGMEPSSLSSTLGCLLLSAFTVSEWSPSHPRLPGFITSTPGSKWLLQKYVFSFLKLYFEILTSYWISPSMEIPRFPSLPLVI